MSLLTTSQVFTVKGFWLAKWFEIASQEQQMKVFGQLTKLIATGKLQARVEAEYDVAQIKEAVAAESHRLSSLSGE